MFSVIYLGCYSGPVMFELRVRPQNAELADRDSSGGADFLHETKQILFKVSRQAEEERGWTVQPREKRKTRIKAVWSKTEKTVV